MPEIDAVLTTAPRRWARMRGRQCFMPRKTLVRVTAITRFQLSSEISWSGAGSARPALLIMRSSRPNVSRASRTVRWTASPSEASILMAAARPPLVVMLAATASARVPLRSATTTAAPSPAKRRAVAAPIPEPPAVTIATWSVNRPGMSLRSLGELVASHGRFVELETETGRLRRQELAALDPRHRREDAGRSGHVLHHVAVRDGREQMHLNLGHHVATHRNPVRVRHRGDLPPRCHATDPGQVENDHVDGLRLEEPPKGVQVIQVLPGRDRDLEPAPKLGEPGHVEVV